MSEIDLIPGAYRRKQQLLRRLRRIAYSSAGTLALILGAALFLQHENGILEDGLERLQHAKAISSQQRANLLDINQRKLEITQQYELLSGLRSGIAAVGMLRTVDRAMADAKVWFTDWSFRRAGSKARVSEAQPQLPGKYLILMPRAQAPAGSEAWVIETQMKIDGEALDHAALSGFVSRLVDQPEIQTVRVIRTETFQQQQRELIRFSLDVVVAWPQREADA